MGVNHIIQPGQLRQTLYLQQSVQQYGNPGYWANVSTDPAIRCALKHLGGGEPTNDGGTRGEQRIEVTMRYRADVTYDKRLSDGNSPARLFDIVDIVDVNEMQHKLVLRVVERSRG